MIRLNGDIPVLIHLLSIDQLKPIAIETVQLAFQGIAELCILAPKGHVLFAPGLQAFPDEEANEVRLAPARGRPGQFDGIIHRRADFNPNKNVVAILIGLVEKPSRLGHTQYLQKMEPRLRSCDAIASASQPQQVSPSQAEDKICIGGAAAAAD